MRPDPKDPDTTRLQRVLDLLQRVRNPPPQVERILLVVAFVGFVVVTVIGWRRLPAGAWNLRPWWLATTAVLSATAVVLNGVEYQLTGRILGHRIPLAAAVRVSLMSTAANLLPLPGSVLVRTQALQQSGERYRTAFAVTTAVGVAWVGAGALLAGPLAIAEDRTVVGLVFLLGGIAMGVVALLLFRLATNAFPTTGLLTRLLALEVVSVLTSGVRIYTVAAGLGLAVSLPDATSINLAGMLASAAGILPGGLGLREVLSGVFAELVGVAGSVGLVIASTDRVIAYAVLATMAGIAIGATRPGLRGTGDDAEQPSGRRA